MLDPVLTLASELVKIPSYLGTPRQESAVAARIAEFLRQRGVEARSIDVREGRPNLLASVDSGRPGPHLVLCGHTDTVPLNRDAPGVGLSGALALGRAGIKCLVLERRAEFSRYPKANGVHARTMELFREWGVAEPVKALTAGMPAGVTIAWRTRLNGIEFGSISIEESEEARRFFGMLSPELLSTAGQHEFEPLLAEAADALDNVTIKLSSEVVSLLIGDDSVTAEYTDATGGRHTVSAQYVIGADGIRSVVRRTLGIGEHGQTKLAGLHGARELPLMLALFIETID